MENYPDWHKGLTTGWILGITLCFRNIENDPGCFLGINIYHIEADPGWILGLTLINHTGLQNYFSVAAYLLYYTRG